MDGKTDSSFGGSRTYFDGNRMSDICNRTVYRGKKENIGSLFWNGEYLVFESDTDILYL